MNRFILYVFVFGVFSTASSQINFENRASDLGVDFTCGTTYVGNGVSFFDFDNDGWDDISFATEDGALPEFYKNFNGQFLPINLNLVGVDYQTKQINWVDFDNDGDNDLFITSNTNGNKLFENTGNLIFQDITTTAGFSTTNMHTYGASWGDYNNDGFLDVFITNRDATASTSNPNYLYRNNGDRTFTDVSVEAGIDRLKHLSFCSAWIDINNDGFQDIYISNDKIEQPFHRNQLYKNNGDGTFTEIGQSSGTNVLIDAMTVTVGDYNSDGWFDIYVTNIGPSVFLRNNGDETFTDIAALTGTEFNSTGWGAIFLDGDNDADLDLYVSGELVGFPQFPSAAFFENLGSDTFQVPTNAGFENDEGYSHSNAIGDINNDGLADFVVTNTNDQNVFLWENKNTENNNWLKVKLEGTLSNKNGIGSVIELSSNGQVQYRYTHCGEGYLSQSSSSEFFGLGAINSIDYIKVKWLSGVEDVFFDIPVNQSMEIVEGSSPLSLGEFQNSDVLYLFPNPTKDRLHIRAHSTVEEVELFNTLGQSVIKKKSSGSEINIDTSKLKSGVYYANIKTNRGTTTKKLLKQ